MIFPSKVDRWLAAWILLAGVGAPAAAVVQLARGGRWVELALALAIVAGAALFVRAIAWPIAYELREADLEIRFGWVKVRVPYARILDVQPSRNPISSPAWSLDRLRIGYRKANGRQTFVLISPVDKERFLSELKGRLPPPAPTVGSKSTCPVP
jgi:hypothetical protein